MAAFKEAVSEGISPTEFWLLTPYLSGIAVNAAYERSIKQAWRTATLMRVKKLPDLKKLLTPDKSSNRMDELKAVLSARQHGDR